MKAEAHLLLPVTTTGAAQTEALGAALAAHVERGDVLALHGDLGAGKTHLVRGLCSALGIAPEGVSSPTFTLIHEYEGGALPVYHFDAYRLAHAGELAELGFDEYLEKGGVCVVEWPERVAPLLPEGTHHLHLSHAGGDRRHIAWNPQPSPAG